MAELAEASSGAARRRRDRMLRSWQRHVRQSIKLVLAERLHHSHDAKCTGPTASVEATKLPQGARPGPLVSASGPQVLDLQAGHVVSQVDVNVVAVPKVDSDGLLSGIEELQKAISMGLLDTAFILGCNQRTLLRVTMRCCSRNVVLSFVPVIPYGGR